MKKSFFYRIMVLSLGALLAGIIACKNPASPEPVKPEQNVQTPSDNGLGGGGTPNPKPGEPTPGGGGGPAPTPNPVNPQTDQERVEAAKAVLELRVNGNNGKVSNWINLPSRGAYGTSISWTSSPSGIINTNAPGLGSNVTRPDDDAVVTLTATITKGSVSATKTFTVTVYGKNQEQADQAIQYMSQQPPAFVMGSGTPPETMTLQKTYGSVSDQVAFEWKAQPEGSVTFSDAGYSFTGTVMQPESSAEKKTVTLTATARKGNSTASRTFTVTVYPKNQEPSLTELLTQIMAAIPAETDKHIPLMSTVANGYHLTWSSSDTDVLDPAHGDRNVKRDLVNRKATLTAELSKGGSPSETAQKEVTVKAQTKFDNCELAGNLLTMKDNDGTATAVYRVQISADAKTITAAAEKVAVNGTLMTLDAAKQQLLADIDSYLPFYRSVLSLCDKQTVTLQDIKDAFSQTEPEAATTSDEEFFNILFKGSYLYADFKTKSAEEKTQFLKEQYLNSMKERFYSELQIPLDTPLEQALAQLKEQESARISANMENAKKQRTYTYRVDNYNNRLYTEEPYVTGTPWYQQHGQYSYYDWASPDIQYISLSSRAKGNGKYDVSISVQKNGSPQGWFSASDYDGSGAITAKTHDGSKQITLTVTDNGSGKVEVTSTGEIPFTAKELTFRGKEISNHPLRN